MTKNNRAYMPLINSNVSTLQTNNDNETISKMASTEDYTELEFFGQREKPFLERKDIFLTPNCIITRAQVHKNGDETSFHNKGDIRNLGAHGNFYKDFQETGITNETVKPVNCIPGVLPSNPLKRSLNGSPIFFLPTKMNNKVTNDKLREIGEISKYGITHLKNTPIKQDEYVIGTF